MDRGQTVVALLPFTRAEPAAQKTLAEAAVLEQINFEIHYISKLSFCRKMRFSAESTPRCGALHACAALEHLNFFKVKML
ncbi:hypothetical protein [Desulfovibrio intestinalis]|uniref:Uncharacterized protein n=1 Tax=Desulfovibrio intestinalis TaxID=58621 RepID=A0A7W8C326_9BACT|nr:hypothetical protein [Desulfovibrio intestinalis]MBB5143532.1 hypothetical protein [Desulfovibrio intestinalis]